MYWKRLSHEEITQRVFEALDANMNFNSGYVLGVPGTYLDTEQFYHDAPFLQDAPFLSTLVRNPNHIGCHTLNEDSSEDLFRGTQKIEIELIDTVSEQILKAEKKSVDGYIAPGGTEANIQAMWIYRNYYRKEFGANNEEIAVVYSEDSHYSFPKGANLLSIKSIIVQVNEETRLMNMNDLNAKIEQAQEKGIKYFIVIQNMSTTMYGSVDNIIETTGYFKSKNLPYKVHVDGAFGGFFYPFTNPENLLDFRNSEVTSVTLDAHKMLQAPYGTGIFLIRKDWMKYAETEEAQYVQGLDFTICGSRSGANAIAIYMILMTHGSTGWKSKIWWLMDLTEKLCQELDNMGVEYYRQPYMNIVAIKSKYVSKELGKKYRLVADSYQQAPKYWKIVVMPHVSEEVLNNFLSDLKAELNQ